MKKVVLLVTVLSFLVGCAMARHMAYVKEGTFVIGMNIKAFRHVWGPPDRVYPITGEDARRAGFVVASRWLELSFVVWVYEDKDIELLTRGRRLIAWKTIKPEAR